MCADALIPRTCFLFWRGPEEPQCRGAGAQCGELRSDLLPFPRCFLVVDLERFLGLRFRVSGSGSPRSPHFAICHPQSALPHDAQTKRNCGISAIPHFSRTELLVTKPRAPSAA